MTEKNKQDLLTELEETFKELPEKAQKAIHWTIKHIDLVEDLCKNSEMTDEEIEAHKITAKATDDYIFLALLCAAQMYHDMEKDKGTAPRFSKI